jgi:hypothetical protein
VQSSEPITHVLFIGLHDVPFVHVLQVPSTQIRLLPQGVPFATLPVDTQTKLPVEHEATPVWHGFPPGEQAMPVVHATHTPLLHTRLCPQEVPFAMPPSAHVPPSQPQLMRQVPSGAHESPDGHEPGVHAVSALTWQPPTPFAKRHVWPFKQSVSCVHGTRQTP